MGRALRRVLLAAAVAVLLVVAAVVVTGTHLAREVGRVPDAFTGLQHRPRGTDPVDVLLVGTYDAGGGATWLPDHGRPVSLMVVHLDGGGHGAAVVALPLTAPVAVPGRGRRRLGSVFAMGGPSLAVGTVERLTGTRIDHLAVVDWHVFERLVDVLGGLELSVDPREVGRATWRPRSATAYVDGDNLMDFVAEQPGVGPVAHLHRELIVLDELMRGSLHQSMHKRPLQTYRFLDALASHLTVDDGWSPVAMGRVVVSLWNLRSADIRYATAPLTCPGPRSDRCRVALDRSAGPAFWEAVRGSRLDGWLVEHQLRGLANRTRVDP